MQTRLFFGSAFALALAAQPAFASDSKDWAGEGSISAAYTSGNTQTTDVGGALKAARVYDDWRVKGELDVDYGKNDDVESRNRWNFAGQLDRDVNSRVYVYGRGTYEQDKFSGFDNRIFVGTGGGYKVLTGDDTSWKLEAGPGYRNDVIQQTGNTEGQVSARIGSAFAHKFNEAVDVSNETEWVYSDVSDQLVNIAALTTKMTEKLSARFSFEVRNESSPQLGQKPTDTATRFSVVYGF